MRTCFFLFFLSVPAILFAQEPIDSAWVKGRITGEFGQPLSGVKVVAHRPDANSILGGGGSDLNGEFCFFLAPGSYQLDFTRLEYKPFEATDVDLALGDTTFLDIVLQGEFTVDSIAMGMAYPELYGFWEAVYIRFDVGDRLRFPDKSKIGLEFSPTIDGGDLGKGPIVVYDGCNYSSGWFYRVLSPSEMAFYNSGRIKNSVLNCDPDYELLYPDHFLYLFEMLSVTDAPV
ncbi:MAG: carboxypeptidase regulatory-like domain-containing protein, partial [Phaeodactylibacter sp.]|nr:carboxypeptidase regulatory-like domain-containing protein [Phaeodactylibacter sp.]